MNWDQDPQVLSPVGRPMSEQMREGPRRQLLDGFDPEYRDIVDYIVRCTHRIWEEKNVGLCRTHYGADCELHTLAGPAVGMEVVTQNTIGALAAYADRVVMAEDVIWSEDAPGEYYSSHRIMSRSTHFGDEPLIGAASMRGSGTTTIADCKVVANRIVEEWLVRDNCRALWQVGADPRAFAEAAAGADREGDQERHAWRSAAIAVVRDVPGISVAADHPAAAPAAMLGQAFSADMYGEAAATLSPTAEIRWPSNRRGFGRGYWIGCVMQLTAMLHERTFRLEHVAARPLPHGDVAVALRWSLVGTHRGAGPWGPPSGRELLLMAVSHYRLRAGSIVEDTTVFDEVAAMRQIAGGLGA
ncbi:ester cyclase [uncultured Sphingomonas sp.]|uniref:ester cyclase n=1 Tax=uncultured Sphingomonas sp. TaxID=158754 RepID=UPI0035C9915C